MATRYAIYDELASGGMAAIFLARLRGAEGFARVVVVKRLHPQYAREREVCAMFLDEARLASRIRHPNVVPVIDVVSDQGEPFLVMELVMGESLSRLLADRAKAPELDVAVAIMLDALAGLHAAHEAHGADGAPMHLVHRDVSPQNILVGADGVARVIDFGIAKAIGRTQTTRDGHVKGKAAYMSPEQARGRDLDRRSDVYAAGVVAWELFTGSRLLDSEDPLATMLKVLEEPVPPPSTKRPSIPKELDAILARACAKNPRDRWPTAHAFAEALEAAHRRAPASKVAGWVEDAAGATLAVRKERIATIEANPSEEEATAPPPLRRLRWGLVLPAGVLALLVVAGVAYAIVPHQPAAVITTERTIVSTVTVFSVAPPPTPSIEPRPQPSVAPKPTLTVTQRMDAGKSPCTIVHNPVTDMDEMHGDCN